MEKALFEKKKSIESRKLIFIRAKQNAEEYKTQSRRYMDAMALAQKYGKPDIFLTMSCNPNWDEIVKELVPGQSVQDRPDLVKRVFRAKMEDLKFQLFHNGVVAMHVHVIEFQKRGLPHAHFLLIK